MLIAIGSDHRGFPHKTEIIAALIEMGHTVKDFGCHGTESADYPEAAFPAAEMVASGEAGGGILICGSGIGMSIVANKVKGIRASLCFNEEQAKTTRMHNNSNMLCLSGDGVDPATAVVLTRAWLASEFEAGRHLRRVDMITAYEDGHMNKE